MFTKWRWRRVLVQLVLIDCCAGYLVGNDMNLTLKDRSLSREPLSSSSTLQKIANPSSNWKDFQDRVIRVLEGDKQSPRKQSKPHFFPRDAILWDELIQEKGNLADTIVQRTIFGNTLDRDERRQIETLVRKYQPRLKNSFPYPTTLNWAAQYLERKITPQDQFPNPKEVDWVIHYLLPALKDLAQSDLSDFSPLYQLQGGLIKDEETWLKLALALEEKVKKIKEELDFTHEDSKISIFQEILFFLNQEWLEKDHLLLWQFNPSPEDLSEFVKEIGVAQIEERRLYPSELGLIPVDIVRTRYLPVQESYPGSFHSATKRIVMFIDQIQAGVEQERPWKIVRIVPRVENIFLEILLKNVCPLIIATYSESIALELSFENTLLEELRHWIDHARVERKTGEHFDRQGSDFCLRFIETQLVEDSFLKEQWGLYQQQWSRVILPEEKQRELIKGSAVLIGTSYIELSGHMNRGIADPILLINVWLKELADYYHRTGSSASVLYWGRTLSAALGIALLAKETGVYQGNISLDYLLKDILAIDDYHDPNRFLRLNRMKLLAQWAVELLQKPVPDLRKAIKKISQRNFIRPIDEAPFVAVSDGGMLLPRHVDSFPVSEVSTEESL